MYKAVRLFNYKDGIGLEQDALRGVCEVEEHVCKIGRASCRERV